jgi:O-6-methylguanine DNA methyltransferase
LEKLVATSFEQQVWNAIALIPRGRVTTYGEIARFIGTRAVRAVGTAVGKNPYAPAVPCHRVVRASGEVGLYSAPGGVAAKIARLQREGVEVAEGYVVDFARVLWRFDQQTTRSSGS